MHAVSANQRQVSRSHEGMLGSVEAVVDGSVGFVVLWVMVMFVLLRCGQYAHVTRG